MVDLEQCSLCAVISPAYLVDLEQCSLCAVISPVYHGGP